MITRTILSVVLLILSLSLVGLQLDPAIKAAIISAQAIAVFCLWIPHSDQEKTQRPKKKKEQDVKPNLYLVSSSQS